MAPASDRPNGPTLMGIPSIAMDSPETMTATSGELPRAISRATSIGAMAVRETFGFGAAQNLADR